MKILPFIALPILAVGAIAQEAADNKLEQRLLRPDMDMKNTSFEQAFSNNGKSALGNETAAVREYQYKDNVRSKVFSTRSFNVKNHWAGDFKFDTKQANTSARSVIKNATTAYDTGEIDLENARESGRGYDTRDYDTRQAVVKGTAQGSIDKQYGVTEPMSLDQVRDLLNKN